MENIINSIFFYKQRAHVAKAVLQLLENSSEDTPSYDKGGYSSATFSSSAQQQSASSMETDT